ncbi:MAG: hypothetical protein BMS9Abin11_0950 [Gammaproteobacteria bacterium]|nr:MAG: hypothetical protein BMS9Abin11_0950 [Gammaproteobacteria bacterium]
MARNNKKKLRTLLDTLSDTQLKTLLDFASYLASSATEQQAPEETDPIDIPRPEKESVIEAIKRLKSTYPMLDSQVMLAQTADLMTQHVMQGRATEQVIDDLESLFKSVYEER